MDCKGFPSLNPKTFLSSRHIHVGMKFKPLLTAKLGSLTWAFDMKPFSNWWCYQSESKISSSVTKTAQTKLSKPSLIKSVYASFMPHRTCLFSPFWSSMTLFCVWTGPNPFVKPTQCIMQYAWHVVFNIWDNSAKWQCLQTYNQHYYTDNQNTVLTIHLQSRTSNLWYW